MKLFETFNIF